MTETAGVASIDPEFKEQSLEALKNVSDPELGVNIVDLGLIYDLAWDDNANALVISMTLTSAGHKLMALAQKLLALESETEFFLRDSGQLNQGELKIGAVGPFHVIEMVASYRATSHYWHTH